MSREVICDSGQKGWRHYLQDNYKTFDSWKSWAETWGLAGRLGYSDTEAGIEEAWDDNPLIQGSVIPSDFRKVKPEEITEEDKPDTSNG